MNNFIGNNGEVQFANGQSSRDLRVGSHARELETQLMEVIDSTGDFFRFIESSTRGKKNNQRRLLKDGSQRRESMENWRR